MLAVRHERRGTNKIGYMAISVNDIHLYGTSASYAVRTIREKKFCVEGSVFEEMEGEGKGR